MRRAIIIVGFVALGACGSDDGGTATAPPVSISDACASAMQVTADEQNLKRADELIYASLDACTSAAEWIAALRAYPGALGLRDASYVDDEMSFTVVCGPEQNATAVCSDASANGIITTLPPRSTTTTLPLTEAEREERTLAWAMTYAYDIETNVIAIGEQLTAMGDAALRQNGDFELAQACVDATPVLEAAEQSAPYGDPDALPAWTAIVDSFRQLWDDCVTYGVDGMEQPLAAVEAAFADFDEWWAAHDLPSMRPG